jgi:hypothetical protein
MSVGIGIIRNLNRIKQFTFTFRKLGTRFQPPGYESYFRQFLGPLVSRGARWVCSESTFKLLTVGFMPLPSLK